MECVELAPAFGAAELFQPLQNDQPGGGIGSIDSCTPPRVSGKLLAIVAGLKKRRLDIKGGVEYVSTAAMLLAAKRAVAHTSLLTYSVDREMRRIAQ